MIIPIAIFFLVAGFFGMTVVVGRKLGHLKKLKVKKSEKEILLRYKQKLKEKAVRGKELVKLRLGDLVLERTISRVKVLAMRVENKCSQLLEKKRARITRKEESKGYWQKLKGLTLKKKQEE